MPKVSDEHKERRRGEILDGARRCFARYGYEGATVARLEDETGLSRGAIFNYFGSKKALFVELAVESSVRLTTVWLEHGFAAVLNAILEEDPDWLSVQLETTRRVRTDPEFASLVAEHEARFAEGRDERLARVREQIRDDVPVEQAAIFLSLVANGLALRQSTGEPAPDVAVLAQLVETGVGKRARRNKRARG